MIIDRSDISAEAFEAGTGWAIKAEGACKGHLCVPLPDAPASGFDALATARTLGMPIVEAPEHGVTALGPASLGGRALDTVEAPDIELEDLEGKAFRLSQLAGRKILLYAWAPY